MMFALILLFVFAIAFDLITARVRRQPPALLPESWAMFTLGIFTGLAIAIAVASIPAEEPDPPEPARPVYIVAVSPAPGAWRQKKYFQKTPSAWVTSRALAVLMGNNDKAK